MKHKAMVHVPAKDELRTVHVTCDICKADVPLPDAQPDNIEKVHVSMEVGDVQYGEGHITETRYDLCLACFRTRLMPWFLSQGAYPDVTETNI